MSRTKSIALSKNLVLVLGLLIISLPFFHLHLPITHFDHHGEHSHSGVVHSIFIQDGVDHTPSPIHDTNPERTEGLLRTTITWNLPSNSFSPALMQAGSNFLWTVSASPGLYTPIDTSITGDSNYSSVLHWRGPTPSSRAPPHDILILV
ncbi:MAG TPA: hypothetical protein VGB26_15030 [Nitrospiria bacterium]